MSKNVEFINDEERMIDRIVPISIPELIAAHGSSNGDTILLEFGYVKNEQTGHCVVDVRKELTREMAQGLYDQLYEILQKHDRMI